jgi:hypothetical protein
MASDHAGLAFLLIRHATLLTDNPVPGAVGAAGCSEAALTTPLSSLSPSLSGPGPSARSGVIGMTWGDPNADTLILLLLEW